MEKSEFIVIHNVCKMYSLMDLFSYLIYYLFL